MFLDSLCFLPSKKIRELYCDFCLLMHIFVFSLEVLAEQDIKNRKILYLVDLTVFGDIKSYDHGIMHTPLWVKRSNFSIKKKTNFII